MVDLFEAAWCIVGGILFPLGIEFSLRTSAENGFPLVSRAKIPSFLKGLAYLFSAFSVLNAISCAYESDTRIAAWALVLGYGIAGFISFRRSSVLRKKAVKMEPNPESCVRPERSGAVNTTLVEQARGGPETKPQPAKD